MAPRRHSLCSQSATVRCRLALHLVKFSCSTFSPPGVLHVLLSCRSWSVFAPIYRPGATLNSCWLEQIEAAIRLTGSGRLHSIGTSRCRLRLIPTGNHARIGLNGFPNLMVIDRTGHVRLTHTGYNSSETSFRRD